MSGRVVVTGAAGFIGSRLVRALLDRGFETIAVVRPGSPPRRLEGCDADVVEADVAGEALPRLLDDLVPATVYHLAAEPGHARTAAGFARAWSTALGGARGVLAAARRAPFRLVRFASSFEVPVPGTLPPPRGVVERAATRAILTAARDRSVDAVALRPFRVFGPGEAPGRLVPEVVRAALDGGGIDLDAGARRDFVYVDDVVDAALAAAARAPAGSEIEVGSGRLVPVERVVEVVAGAAGAEIPVRFRPARRPEVEAAVRAADPEAARRHLGWAPGISLEEGLARTVEAARAARS